MFPFLTLTRDSREGVSMITSGEKDGVLKPSECDTLNFTTFSVYGFQETTITSPAYLPDYHL